MTSDNSQTLLDDNDFSFDGIKLIKIISTSSNRRRSILDLTAQQARAFFNKPGSYSKLAFPPYIQFGDLIESVDGALSDQDLLDPSCQPWVHDRVNYTILANKDGACAWRPFDLIHPALYVSLVRHITADDHWQFFQERFSAFGNNSKIDCLSIPVESLSDHSDTAEQVSQWWESVEQRSIELSLEYTHLTATDIANCYASLHVPAISWALHAKPIESAPSLSDASIGSVIETHLHAMHQGRFSGIPQGTVLTDFIAEIVLSRVDVELSEQIAKAKIDDYHILRYRDDYRIFTNNAADGTAILQILIRILARLGLELNSDKTKVSDDVVRSSIKADKLSWLARKHSEPGLQKHLFIIHDHARQFPNSGSLMVALNDFYRRILGIEKIYYQIKPMIAMVVDLICRNPRTCAMGFAIVSRLLSMLPSTQAQKTVLNKIKHRISRVSNNCFLQLWMQRISLRIDSSMDYSDPLCQLVSGQDVPLWNSAWINFPDLVQALSTPILDQSMLRSLDPEVSIHEVELFHSKEVKNYAFIADA